MNAERASMEPLAHQWLRKRIEGIVELRISAKSRAKMVVNQLSLKTPLEGFGDAAPKLRLEVLAGGFGGGITDTTRMSFLAYCLKRDADDVVRAVIKSTLAPREELIRLICSWRFAPPMSKTESGNRLVVDNHVDFWSTVIEENSGIGVGLALEFCGDDEKLRGPSDFSAHALALHKACTSVALGGSWAFKVNLPICKTLITVKAPILVDGAENRVMDSLATLIAKDGFEAQHQALFELYHGAGLLDPTKRLTSGALGFAGKLPLTAAILLHNKTAALELMAMGADPTVAGDDADMPGLGALDVLRVTPTPNRMTEAGKQEFIADMTAACMQHRLSKAGPSDDEAGATPSVSTRRRRASL